MPWAASGVGAVATQSLVDPAYGPLGLELMARGRSAPETLKGLLASDSGADVRQVAVVDASGRVAAHTGARAISAAGHRTGAQYSVQANLMENSTVWDAMAAAYEGSTGDHAERLLLALEAAEKEGGDIRGRQSAAMLIVRGETTGKFWVDRIFDLRVEDHPEPLRELRRLVQLQRAYLKLNEGDEWLEKNDFEKALEAYHSATEIVPDAATGGEAAFWVGVTLLSRNRESEALPYLHRAQSQRKMGPTHSAITGERSAARRGSADRQGHSIDAGTEVTRHCKTACGPAIPPQRARATIGRCSD